MRPRDLLLHLGLETSSISCPSAKLLSSQSLLATTGASQHTYEGAAQVWPAPLAGEVQGARVAEPGLKGGCPEANSWALSIAPKDSRMDTGPQGTSVYSSHL